LKNYENSFEEKEEILSFLRTVHNEEKWGVEGWGGGGETCNNTQKKNRINPVSLV